MLLSQSTDHARLLELVFIEKVYYFVYLVHWMLCYYGFWFGECPWVLCPSQDLQKVRPNYSFILRTNAFPSSSQASSCSFDIGRSGYCRYSRWGSFRCTSRTPLWMYVHLLLVHGRPLGYRNLVRHNGTLESICSLCHSTPLRRALWWSRTCTWC